MNQAPSFSNILDRQAADVERPKPIPTGSYICVVKGLPRYDKSTKKQTPFAEFTMPILQAMEDVDPEALEEALSRKDGTKKSLQEIVLKNTYYTTEDALWRLKEFCEHCGADIEGKSLRSIIENLNGSQVGVTIRHEPSEDGTAMFARIGNTFAVA